MRKIKAYQVEKVKTSFVSEIPFASSSDDSQIEEIQENVSSCPIAEKKKIRIKVYFNYGR